MRSEVLAAASVGLTALVLANAWVQRQQFYPSVVYITKSNPSMAVIYLQVELLITNFFCEKTKAFHISKLIFWNKIITK